MCPRGGKDAYDQMLLNDTGNTGLTSFKVLVESQGYTISDHYDAVTTLSAGFLRGFDVVIFGLHQKMWTEAEKDNLRDWLNAGGGILIYSDSASGGRFNIVGISNPVGRNVTNNLIAEYGMEVTVDLGGGRDLIAQTRGLLIRLFGTSRFLKVRAFLRLRSIRLARLVS